nr:long chain fatty acid-CoA synthetase [Mycobacterium sp. Marseille-P9652]
MPVQPTLRHPRALRSGRAHRVQCPTIGQCFDIEISRDPVGWRIWIPEIGGVARAVRRDAVELAARECIADRTGIPIGYVTVYVARETVGAE